MMASQVKSALVVGFLEPSIQHLVACPELKFVLIAEEDTTNLRECYLVNRDETRGARLVRQDITMLQVHSSIASAFRLNEPPTPTPDDIAHYF